MPFLCRCLMYSEVFITEPQETVHGLLSYGSIICYLWREFILLKKSYAL